MTEHEASRTLVKSPPELWAECSEAGSLARHLGEFGEIRITRLEPETAVAWEGERVSGTVRIEPSGWGTRVTLTAQLERVEVVAAPEPEVVEREPVVPEPEPEPEPEADAVAPEPVSPEPEPAPEAPPPEPVAGREPLVAPSPPPRRGFLARLRTRFAPQPDTAPGPTAAVAAAPEAKPVIAPPPAPEPVVEPEPVAVEPEPEPVTPDPEPVAVDPEPVSEPEIDAGQILVSALDSLGQAHHRPFSRS